MPKPKKTKKHSLKKTKKSDPNELHTICQEKTGILCDEPIWNDVADTQRIYPNSGTVAIIVDMRDVTCAVQIFNKEDEYKGQVDMGDEGYLVMVLWKPDWTYFCLGDCRVAHVVKKRQVNEGIIQDCVT